MAKGVIVLLTDFGIQDPFIGVMKGVIKGINPEVDIIDLSHSVEPQSVRQAAFYLSISYEYFPKGSIFVCVVDPGVGSQREILLVETDGYYFIVPNNGLISYILKGQTVKMRVGDTVFQFHNGGGSERIIKVDNDYFFLKPVSNTFHGRDIFAPVAAYLSLSDNITLFGSEFKGEIVRIPKPKCELVEDKIITEIAWIDRFGNLITACDSLTLGHFLGGFQPVVSFKGKTIIGLKKSYQEGEEHEPLCIINSFNYLEIAVKNGNARKYFDAFECDEVEISKCTEV